VSISIIFFSAFRVLHIHKTFKREIREVKQKTLQFYKLLKTRNANVQSQLNFLTIKDMRLHVTVTYY